MKILVTGGAGFIGSNVVDALVREGYEVAILDNLSTGRKENLNSYAKFYNVDITDFEGVEKVFKDFKPEILYHLAAQIDVRKSVSNPVFDGKVNVLGSINLFKLSVEYGVKRVIFSSTGGALYGEPSKLPATEDTLVEPLSPYGVSKYCGENYLNYFKRLYGGDRYASLRSAHDDGEGRFSGGGRDASIRSAKDDEEARLPGEDRNAPITYPHEDRHRRFSEGEQDNPINSVQNVENKELPEETHGFERVILRYANVYGPRQDPLGEAGVIAIFIGKILKGERPIIYGDGTQTRDYIFVEDVVRANLLALTGKEGTYNIGTGIETSVNKLVEILSEVFGKKIEPIYTEERPGEVKRITLDVTLAKEVLGFVPQYSLYEGIKKTVEWFKTHKEYLG
jgi:nucleoside-diphosphate-sugar epimerase